MPCGERARIGDGSIRPELTARHDARGPTLLQQLPRRDRAIQLFQQHQREPRIALADRTFDATQLTHFFVEPERAGRWRRLVPCASGRSYRQNLQDAPQRAFGRSARGGWSEFELGLGRHRGRDHDCIRTRDELGLLGDPRFQPLPVPQPTTERDCAKDCYRADRAQRP